MQQLLDTRFEGNQLPDGWIEASRGFSFEAGVLRSGPGMNCRFMVPGYGWGRLRLEAEIEPVGGAVVTCQDGKFTTAVDLTRGTHRITFYGPRALNRTKTEPLAVQGARHLVAFEFDQGRIRATVDGREVITGSEPSPSPAFGLLGLGFHEDCRVHRVRIFGGDPLNAPPFPVLPRRGSLFDLEVAVDFVDDLMAAPWDAGMLDRLFGEFREWGVRRCQWIYYGTRADGWWDHAGWAPWNVERTHENLGEVFPAAVRAAHAHGIEIHALIKPFDMGFYYSEPDGLPTASSRGKLPRIGGSKRWIANFPARYRDLVMARKPGTYGPAVNDAFTRIDLVHEASDPIAFAADQVELYVSNDNATYHRYDGAFSVSESIEDVPVWEHTASGGRPTDQRRRSRVLRLEGFSIRDPFLALRFPGRAQSFANTFLDLIHVYGERGEERRLTYGLLPRAPLQGPDERDPEPHGARDFREVGVEFDVAPGPVPAVQPGYDFITTRHVLDAGHGFLAIARGKEPGPIAALSPSFPRTREWWLSWVRDALDAGADGVEARVRAHNYNLDWACFGFEPPVVHEFRRRYGVDLLATDDFDREAWRRLRGEGYTQFLREASTLVRSRGKVFGIHVSPTLDMDPAIGAAMDIHWDWRTWLAEGLADRVTAKEVWPGTRLAQELLAYTRTHATPVIFSPYGLTLWSRPGGERTVSEWIRLAREQGFDGYQFYECCAIVRGTRDGQVVMQQPKLRELFKKEFVR